MNILNVSQNYYVVGGSDRYFFDLSNLLEQKGHRVIPFAGQSPKNLPSEWSEYFPDCSDFENPGIADALQYIYNPDAKRQLSRLLDNEKVDIAHLHIYYGKLTGSILGEFTKRNIPIVQTLHEYKPVCPIYTCYRNAKPCTECSGGKFYNALKNRCNRRSLARSALTMTEAYTTDLLGARSKINKYIAISEFVRHRVSSMGVSAQRIQTIHNFVTNDKFCPKQEKGDYFVFAGRIEPLKGIYTLLKAAAKLENIHFKIAGHGSDSERVKELVKTEQLENVEILGFLPNEKLKELIAKAKACIVPSEWDEPFGLSVIESFAAGTTVIASDSGGIPEIITHEKDGLIFEAGNSEELAKKIQILAENPGLVETLSLAALETAHLSFSEDFFYEQLIALYDELITNTKNTQTLEN